MVRFPRGGPGDREKTIDSRMVEADDKLDLRQRRAEKINLTSGFRMDREAIF